MGSVLLQKRGLGKGQFKFERAQRLEPPWVKHFSLRICAFQLNEPATSLHEDLSMQHQHAGWSMSVRLNWRFVQIACQQCRKKANEPAID